MKSNFYCTAFYLFIVLTIRTNVTSQNIQFKQIDIGGKTSVFSQNIIDSEIKNLQNFDIVDFILTMESRNNGFRIPKSDEVKNIIEYKKIFPKGTTRQTCDNTFCRTYRCVKPDGFMYYNLALGAEGKEPTHPHYCNNCSNWNVEYRRKTACHKCKDEGWTFCGKTLACPRCDGRGYVIKETEEKILVFNDILEDNNIQNCKSYFYYDSPIDYGLYLTSGTKIKLIGTIHQDNIGLILVEGQHDIEQEFLLLKEKQKNEDQNAIIVVRRLLSQSNITEAIEKYDALNLQETKNAFYNEMQLALSEHYKTVDQPFKDEQLAKIINDNKTAFNKLSLGIYKLTSDSEGNLSIEGRELGIKSAPLTKTLGSNNQFIVNTSASGNIRIEQTINHIGGEKILVSTKKTIYQTAKGRLYKKVFLGGPGAFIDLVDHRQINVTIKEDIPRNKYQLVQPIIVRTTANGIEIISKNENKLLFEEKFKNRALVVSSRALLIAGGLFFGALRIYEYSRIP
jgi:hypothetical protein